MDLFEAKGYKHFVRARLRTFPNRGYGQYRRMAKHLKVHVTLMTHIFSGDSHLTVEQAVRLSDLFNFSPLQTDYFVNLVQRDRAGDPTSRQYFQRQMEGLKTRAGRLEQLDLTQPTFLTETDQALYDSAWHFAAIRALIPTADFKSAEAIAHALNLPLLTVVHAVEFMVSQDILRVEKGSYLPGPRETRPTSAHHRNWRLQAIDQLDQIPEDELVFTSAVPISRKDFAKIGEALSVFVEFFNQISRPSAPEELCYLSIDWRRVRAKRSL